MPIVFANNATSLTAFPTLTGDTVITIEAADVALFPVPDPATGVFFYATLEDRRVVPTRREIVKVTSRSNATYTVVRGQDGTVAGDYFTGAIFSARLNRAALLQLIQDEANARIAADIAEATARAAGDAALQANIDAEANARAAGDASLQAQLNAEINRAQNAETNLQNQINSGTAVYATKDELNNDITTERNARIAADNAEITARANADTAEANTRAAAVNALAVDINNEANARIAADAYLQSEIDALAGQLGSGTIAGVQTGTSMSDTLGFAAIAVVFPHPFATKTLEFQVECASPHQEAYFSRFPTTSGFSSPVGTLAPGYANGYLNEIDVSSGTVIPVSGVSFKWWATGV